MAHRFLNDLPSARNTHIGNVAGKAVRVCQPTLNVKPADSMAKHNICLYITIFEYTRRGTCVKYVWVHRRIYNYSCVIYVIYVPHLPHVYTHSTRAFSDDIEYGFTTEQGLRHAIFASSREGGSSGYDRQQ